VETFCREYPYEGFVYVAVEQALQKIFSRGSIGIPSSLDGGSPDAQEPNDTAAHPRCATKHKPFFGGFEEGREELTPAMRELLYGENRAGISPGMTLVTGLDLLH
jgi:hypothetical protein